MKTRWTRLLLITGILGVSTVSTSDLSAQAASIRVPEPETGLLQLAVNASMADISSEAEPESVDPLSSGMTRYEQGRFAAAISAWQIGIAHAYHTGDIQREAIFHSLTSLAHQELNDWAAAETHIQQSLALLEAAPPDTISPLLRAQIVNTQAALSYYLGQTEHALEQWQQAENYYQQGDDSAGQLGARINQAQALQSLGFYRRSRQQLEAITTDLAEMPDSVLKVNGYRSLGNALQVLGDLTASRTALFESANIAIALNHTPELSATYLSLGRAAHDWGDLNAAVEMFYRAKQAAVSPSDQLQAELNLLSYFVDQAQTDYAAESATAIAQLLETLPPSRLTVYGTVNLSASLSREANPGQSLPIEQVNQLLTKAVADAQDLGDPQAEAYALNQWGALYMQTQQWTDAQQLTEKSLDLARALNAEDIASQSAWQLGRILKQQGKTDQAIVAYTEAVDALQALRSDLVAIDPDVQFSFRENVEPIYREFVSLLLSTSSQQNKSAAEPTQENLLKAREVIEALQLAELDNFFQEACIDVVAEQIDQVDQHATVIYPIILPDRLAVIASSADQPLRYYETELDQQTVEATLHELLSTIHPAADNNHRLELSQQVYDWLIRPAVDSEITQETQTLVFVLDGLLRNIPIAALHDGERYVIEDYAVALSPGLQLMNGQGLSQIQPDAIVGGISESRNGLSALPAVENEIADIDRLISTQTLFNEEFTADALASNVQDSSANIVHLATHGQFSSRLEDTFLSTWDGQLNVTELAEILQKRGQSSPIELLVLSACDTATGDDRAVLGLAGLAVKSGARSTIATLWPVRDSAAALLMRELYEGMAQPGMSNAEALRQAQLSLLEDPTYRDPFFWSAYTIVGNWQ